MPDHKGGATPPTTVETVRDEDWYGLDLSGRTFSRVAFVDVDLSEVTSTGAVFDECTFRSTRFNCSTHVDGAFVNCSFHGCNLFQTAFTRCKLVGSTFDRCSFDLLAVTGGDWSFVGLPGADLRRASMTGVRMREADLGGTRCTGARLTDLDLSGASLEKADLSECDLRGSDLSALDPGSTVLRGAIITWEQAAVLAGNLGLDVRPQ